MTNAKPTPGPWMAQSDPCDYDRKTDVYSRRTFVASVQSGNEADASLIAEAGAVYHETGLTPRQLAEQRAAEKPSPVVQSKVVCSEVEQLLRRAESLIAAGKGLPFKPSFGMLVIEWMREIQKGSEQ